MKQLIFISILTLWASGSIRAQSDDFRLSGYIQAMSVYIDADLPALFEKDSFWEHRFQNRLNLQYRFTSNFSLNWEMRTRFFAGELVSELNDLPGPGYRDLIDVDDGIVNLSWVIADRDRWLLHYIPDRLNLDWYNDEWRITAGRQRINWGINTVTNPNDLFNIYSFYEFDYPERPGTDAVRIQHFIDWASRIELAWSPAKEVRNSVAAAMYVFNTRGYDIQVITGYYRDRLGVGGGWAGSIRQSGFKGEVMLFTDLEENSAGDRPTNLVAAVSADHMFDNSLFLIIEGLYNKDGGSDRFVLLGEPLAADNPSFSRYQFTTSASYPFSPVWNGSLAAIWYPDEEALFVSPSVTWSVGQNTDFNMLSQIFIGGESSAFANAGSIVAASLKWNF
ncbi:hypothetical protein [Rhodohalobacter mucosus]|uniref:Alginate export domain-containing protein n=1 Tax=Rhodohalobacter mucosus TaxID=2079485 RepID=A0A316TWP5_9BACT|nr:hypothetical protein [Rhodohalobacter mucosus]PWN07665.1 hypothetical protein DDZ15_01165 [Rhodohalobacter mucosus]